jgi:hypothetical protein
MSEDNHYGPLAAVIGFVFVMAIFLLGPRCAMSEMGKPEAGFTPTWVIVLMLIAALGVGIYLWSRWRRS